MRWILLLLVLGACSGGLKESTHGHWSYEGDTGPEHWAELDPHWEIAASGRHQSPVDLGAAQQGSAGSLKFHYLESAVRVSNTGHSIQLNVEPGSWVEVDGARYQLSQLHLHSPSEHTVDGEHSAIEMHCVHRSDEGKLAVVGLLIDAGSKSAGFESFLQDIPEAGEVRTIPNARIDLASLLPDDLDHEYRYTGSLTTPPCSEDVEWVVLKSHTAVSAEQIEAYRKYYYGNNRPIQALNDRELRVD